MIQIRVWLLTSACHVQDLPKSPPWRMYWSTTEGVAEQRLTPLFARGSPRFHNRSFPRLTTFINGAPSSHHPQTTFINGLNPSHPSHCLGKGRWPKKSYFLVSSPPAQKKSPDRELRWINHMHIVTFEKPLIHCHCWKAPSKLSLLKWSSSDFRFEWLSEHFWDPNIKVITIIASKNGYDAFYPFGLDNFEMITSIWKSVANDQSKPEAQEDLWEQPFCQSNWFQSLPLCWWWCPSFLDMLMMMAM